MEGCPSQDWNISWEETVDHFCAPNTPGLAKNYTRQECEDLCLSNALCSAYDYNEDSASCMYTSGKCSLYRRILY